MMKLLEDENMTVATQAPRSWRERLTSWPWRPWRSWKVVNVPSDNVYVIGKDTIVAHPETCKTIRAHVTVTRPGLPKGLPHED